MSGESLSLFDAVKTGTVNDVRSILEREGFDIDQKITKRGGTALSLATRLGHLEVCRLLVERFCDIDCTSNDGLTPLQIAAASGKFHIAELLCSFKCNIECENPDGMRAIHFAVQNDNRKIVRLLIDHNCNINARTALGATPVFIAAQNGFAVLVKHLLSKNCDIRLPLTKMKTTPLFIAAAGGHEKVVKMLVDASEEMDFKLTPDGRNPLIVSFTKGFSGIVDCILDSPVVNFEAAMTTSAETGHLELVKSLLKRRRKARDYKSLLQRAFKTAAAHGRMDIVKYIVDVKSDIDDVAVVLKPGVMAAVKSGNLEMVQFLLCSKFVIENSDEMHRVIFDQATERGHFDIVRLLFETQWKPKNAVVWAGAAVKCFVTYGALEHIQWLFESDFLHDQYEEHLEIAFSSAAGHGHLRILEFLKTLYPANKKPPISSSIEIASTNGYLNVVRYLVQLDLTNGDLQHWRFMIANKASANQHIDLVRWAIRSDVFGGDPFLFGVVIRVALMAAAENGCVAVLQDLFDSPVVENCGLQFAVELLPLIAENNQVSSLRYLWKSYLLIDADLSETLLRAAASGSDKVVHFLLCQGYDPNVILSEEEGTPLHLAASNDRIVVARRLLSSSRCERNSVTSKGVTPLHAAVKAGHFNMTQLLLQEGCDVRKVMNNGATTLHVAADAGSAELVNLLVSFGADRDARMARDLTPLMIAVRAKHLDAVMALVAAHCDVNAVAENGSTALILAANVGDASVCKALIDAGCDLRATNSHGMTALQLAQKHLHGAIVALIYNATVVRNAIRLRWIERLQDELSIEGEERDHERIKRLFLRVMNYNPNHR